jgi:hypothetical protein
MRWYFWIILLVTDIVVVFAALKVFDRRQFLVADKVGAAAVLLSVNTFLLIKSFVIDGSQCGESPTFACLLNTNRGVWTFGALCVAATTLYVNARMKQREQLMEESKERDSAIKVISASVDELIHNLQHFANEIDDHHKFISFPATSLEATYGLLRGDVATYCSSRIISRIGNLQRITNHNRAMLRSAAELDDSLRTIALMDDEGVAVFSRSKLLRSLERVPVKDKAAVAEYNPPNGRILNFDVVRCDERIITHSVRCVM